MINCSLLDLRNIHKLGVPSGYSPYDIIIGVKYLSFDSKFLYIIEQVLGVDRRWDSGREGGIGEVTIVWYYVE